MFTFTVPFEEYKQRYADDHMAMKVDTVVKVQETNKTYCDDLSFQLVNQENSVKVEFSKSEATVGEELELILTFTNPLPIPLTELVVSLEGPGLVSPTRAQISGSVPAHGAVTLAAAINPSRSGSRWILVDIDAKEQKDFKGEATIYVNAA